MGRKRREAEQVRGQRACGAWRPVPYSLWSLASRLSPTWRRRESNPQRREGLSFAALPICVPRREGERLETRGLSMALASGLSPLVSMAQVGVEPTASLVLSQGGLPIAYRAKGIAWRPEGHRGLVGARERISPLSTLHVSKPEAAQCACLHAPGQYRSLGLLSQASSFCRIVKEHEAADVKQ